MTIFLGEFSNLDDVVHAFAGTSWDSPPNARLFEEQIRADVQGDSVLVAAYDWRNDEGEAFVLYQKNGTLYEVNAGYDSCFGLEGQWEPDETSWTALRQRRWGSWDYQPTIAYVLGQLDPGQPAGVA